MFHQYVPAYAPCSGRPLVGTSRVQVALLDRFDRAFDYGIYNCRALTTDASVPSIHSDGRAGDVGFPDGRTGARTPVTTPHWQGYALVELLRAHAYELGIMGIIWDSRRWDWRTPYGRAYYGPNPHKDHVHYEQTPLYAATLTLDRAYQLIGEPMSFNTAEEAALKRVAPYASVLADLAKALVTPGPTTAKVGGGQSLLHVLEAYRLTASNAGIDPTDHQAMARLLGQ